MDATKRRKSGKHVGELNTMSAILFKSIQLKGMEWRREREKGKPSLTVFFGTMSPRLSHAIENIQADI